MALDVNGVGSIRGAYRDQDLLDAPAGCSRRDGRRDLGHVTHSNG